MSTTSLPPTPKPRRRWIQFSLRTLMLIMFLLGIGLSWMAAWIQRARQQKEVVEAIAELGGWVCYDCDFDEFGEPSAPAEPSRLAWLHSLFREDLDLSDTRVSDTGLAHLKGLTQLQHLDLRDTQVTDAGITALQMALPNAEIYR
jgi:hypothetical protein